MNNVPPSDEISIDEILKRVRAELADSAHPSDTRRFHRRTTNHIPLLNVDEVSGEQRLSWSIDDFERLDEESFLQAAYRVVLGRDIDGSGIAHFLPALREGRATVIGILGSLRYSPEGETRGVAIAGLKRAWFVDRATRAPFVGRLVGPIWRMVNRSRSLLRLQRRIAATDLRHRQLIEAMNGSLFGVRRVVAQLEMETSRLESATEQARALAQSSVDGMEGANIELAAARRQIADESRALIRLIDKASLDMPQKSMQQIGEHAFDALYVAFENRFRGSTVEIGTRQARYIDMFRLLEPVAAGGVVLDIGCGRGEWLKLLSDANINACGVDLNAAMAEHAQAQGFEVTIGDAIEHLRALDEDSLAAITGFHIIEHLDFRDLVTLFDEAWRALAPGGAILFETPNPENLVVGACTFNYDPTHKKPLPPDLSRFLAEMRGYADIRIIRTDADCRLDQVESGFAPTEINDWFRQPADYALFARKMHHAGDA